MICIGGSNLVVRAFYAVSQTRRLLRRQRSADLSTEAAQAAKVDPKGLLDAHSAAMAASLAGWFVCAFFASVAYNWTFYYLLALAAAPREMIRDSAFAKATADEAALFASAVKVRA